MARLAVAAVWIGLAGIGYLTGAPREWTLTCLVIGNIWLVSRRGE